MTITNDQTIPSSDDRGTGSISNELDRLRDILYGEQMRTLRNDQANLENKVSEQAILLATTQQQLAETRRELASARQELNQRDEQTFNALATQIKSLQTTLLEKIDQQAAQCNTQITTGLNNVNQRLDSAITEFDAQLKTLREELEKEIKGKVSRENFGQALAELGKQIQADPVDSQA